MPYISDSETTFRVNLPQRAADSIPPYSITKLGQWHYVNNRKQMRTLIDADGNENAPIVFDPHGTV